MKQLFFFLTILLLAGLFLSACETGNKGNGKEPPSIDVGGEEDDENKGTEEPVIEEEAELVELSHWHFTSGMMPNRIIMKHPDENVVFYCTVDNGHFRTTGHYVPTKNINMHSGEFTYWADFEKGVDGQYLGQVFHAFIEIVLILEENIIGYALIEAYKKPTDSTCNAILLKSVFFPQINGEYQNVSEEYVKTEIEKIKDEAKGIDVAFFEVETEDMIESYLIPTSVDVSLIQIELKNTDENVVFECTVDKGAFFLYDTGQTSKNVSVVPSVIHWRPMEPEAFGTRAIIEQAFVDVILKADDNIIGYAVIEILQNIIPVFHSATVLKSALIPQVDGEYQNVTEKQIKAATERVKRKALVNSG